MPFTPLFGTGFELGTTLILGNTSNNIASGGKTGSYFATGSGYDGFTFNLPTSGSDLYFNIWCSTNGWSASSDHGIDFYITDGNYISIKFLTTDYITYRINTTTIATGTTVIAANTWFNIKLHLVINDTTGVIDAKVNGIDDCSYSGDTKPGTGTNIYRVQQNQNYSTSRYISVDDFTYGTGDWPLDYRYLKYVPTADTATKDFTPSTGVTNYNLVDEVPPSSSDYVYSSTNGHKDLYDITDFTADYGINTISPQFTMQWIQAWKDTAESQQFKFLQKLGATEYASSAKDLTTSAALYWDLRTTDPDGNAWTDSNVDSLKIGHEAVIT